MEEKLSGGLPEEAAPVPYASDLAGCVSTRMREITISPLDVGFIVRVGCQSLAISNKKQLLEELTNYFNNPTESERRYYKEEFGERNNK